jgi:hypothetical protein
MSELLLVFNRLHFKSATRESLTRSLSMNRTVHLVVTNDVSAPDLRIFDLDKLPDAEREEIIRVVEGVIAE